MGNCQLLVVGLGKSNSQFPIPNSPLTILRDIFAADIGQITQGPKTQTD